MFGLALAQHRAATLLCILGGELMLGTLSSPMKRGDSILKAIAKYFERIRILLFQQFDAYWHSGISKIILTEF